MSPIHVFTERGMIRTVAERWRAQYPPGPYADTDGSKARILTRLEALDPESASADDVLKAIGNSSWTDLHCDNCGRRRLLEAVQVGEEPDYETATAVLCFDCAEAAVSALRHSAVVPA